MTKLLSWDTWFHPFDNWRLRKYIPIYFISTQRPPLVKSMNGDHESERKQSEGDESSKLRKHRTCLDG